MTTQPRAVHRIDVLSDRLAQLDPSDQEWRQEIEGKLRDAKSQAEGPNAKALQIWPKVHSLEESLNERDGDLDYLAGWVDHHLRNQPDATAREAARKEFGELKAAAEKEDDPAGPKHVAALDKARFIIAESHERSRATFDSAHKTQVGLWWLSAALLAGGVIAVIAQSNINASFIGSHNTSTLAGVSDTWFLAILLFAGALGGVFSALYSLYLTKDVEDTSWNDPRPALTITKVAIGSWASVLTVMAMGAGVVDGQFKSLGAAILIGASAGYAQQAVTRILDNKTAGLVKK